MLSPYEVLAYLGIFFAVVALVGVATIKLVLHFASKESPSQTQPTPIAQKNEQKGGEN